MANLFKGASSFNGNIEMWDTSAVENFHGMFAGASSFNQPIGRWDVSSATDMRKMFECATSFNHDLSQWDVSKVTDMGLIFCGASAFEQDLSEWNTSNVSEGWKALSLLARRNFKQRVCGMFDGCPVSFLPIWKAKREKQIRRNELWQRRSSFITVVTAFSRRGTVPDSKMQMLLRMDFAVRIITGFL